MIPPESFAFILNEPTWGPMDDRVHPALCGDPGLVPMRLASGAVIAWLCAGHQKIAAV